MTILSQLQTNIERTNIDEILRTLLLQDDKKTILDILMKELTKANEQRAILICFISLKLMNPQTSQKLLEDALWNILKNPSVLDSIKAIVLNVLKDMGNKVDYEKLEEFFENPNEVIDADTQQLLQSAIINPEAQIDFLDFLNSLSDADKKVLVQSLGEDYSSDNLANILNPLALYEPNSELGHLAIDILGSTKSQLALHTLSEALEFTADEVTIALIKKNISTLKISGVREDNAMEFYAGLLQSKPYCSYTSYPDGHGNQAIIFSREREDNTIQIVAMVINDSNGLVDCFGFNEISKPEFERIVEKFYNNDEHLYLDASVIKTILLNAEKLTRQVNKKVSYEFLCWKTLLSDIEEETTPMEASLNSLFDKKPLADDDLNQIFMFDFIQRWFFDADYSEEFKQLVTDLNEKINTNSTIDLESAVKENTDKIFTPKEKSLLSKRILESAYLKYLSGSIEDAQLLYLLYFDENQKNKLAENIVRKSIYEYYVLLKFKHREEQKMTDIFSLRNKQKTFDLTPKQIESMISKIESQWVQNA